MTHTNSELEELRRLAHRYGIPLDLVDRLTLRPREVARVTGFSLLTVRKWIDSGELEVIQVPGGLAVSLADLLRFLEQHKVARQRRKSASLADRARALLDGQPPSRQT